MEDLSKTKFYSALENILISKTKVKFGEYLFEYVNLNSETLEDAYSFPKMLNSDNVGDSASDHELTFIKFLGDDFVKHPFILVYKEVKSTSDTENYYNQQVSESLNQKKSETQLPQNEREVGLQKEISAELWGSPLKSNLPSEESLSELDLVHSPHFMSLSRMQRPKRMGLALNVARLLTSAYTSYSSCEMKSYDLPALIVMCDGADCCTTAVLGIRIFQVPLISKSATIYKTTTLVLDKKSDDSNFKMILDSMNMQDYQAIYQVGNPYENEAEGEESWGFAELEMRWKGTSQPLEMPPSDASTSIRASVKSGNMRSSMYKFYQELQFLRNIITAITTGEIVWITNNSGNISTSQTLAVRSLIQKFRDGGITKAGEDKDAEKTPVLASSFNSISVQVDRTDFDFTDLLWKVLVNCTSTSDLVNSMKIIFASLNQGQLLPFVERQNQSTIAQIIRDSFSGRFTMPSLIGSQPFLFLAEIGIEKLQRDYINIFVSQHLVSASNLIVLTTSSVELLARLEKLEKLHSTLEMIFFLARTLCLQTDTLCLVAKQLLTHYQQHPVLEQDVFSFSTKMSEVRTVLNKLSPVRWCVETNSNTCSEDVKESTLHCLCAVQPFLHLQGRENSIYGMATEKSVTNGNGKNSKYFLVHRSENAIID